MQPHEYSVIGHSRATVGRYLGVLAGLISSGCALGASALFDLAREWGLSQWVPESVQWPLTAALFYAAGHWLFDTWAWRSSPMLKVLKIPDLNGDWECAGTTLGPDGAVLHQWTAVVTISQTWEKIRVYLNTGQSRSASVSAALLNEPGCGHRLMYSYRNEPKIGEPELNPHVGYCELVFDQPLAAAEGDYFNNKGRVTFGRMALTRKAG